MSFKFFLGTVLACLLFISACEDQGTAPAIAQTPSITRINPSAALAGDTVTISGADFGSSTETNEVTFGTTTASIVSANPTQIKTVVPTSLAAGQTSIILRVSGQSSNTKVFQVITSDQIVHFLNDIRSLITQHGCGPTCHGSNGGFSVATHTSIVTRVIAGAGDESLIVRKLRGEAGTRMPQGGPYMTPAEIQKFVDWINQGALNN